MSRTATAQLVRQAGGTEGHGGLGVTLGPVTGRRLAEFIRTGRRPEEPTPFRFDRLRGRLSP